MGEREDVATGKVLEVGAIEIASGDVVDGALLLCSVDSTRRIGGMLLERVAVVPVAEHAKLRAELAAAIALNERLRPVVAAAGRTAMYGKTADANEMVCALIAADVLVHVGDGLFDLAEEWRDQCGDGNR
jgi:hypothetical protein